MLTIEYKICKERALRTSQRYLVWNRNTSLFVLVFGLDLFESCAQNTLLTYTFECHRNDQPVIDISVFIFVNRYKIHGHFVFALLLQSRNPNPDGWKHSPVKYRVMLYSM